MQPHISILLLLPVILAPEAAPVARLSSPAYVVRERAQAELVAGWLPAALACEHWARAHSDSETRGRCKAAAEAFFDVATSTGGLSWISHPEHGYALTLVPEMQAHMNAAQRKSREVWDALDWWNHPDGGQGSSWDQDWREAARLWAVDQLRSGVPRVDVVWDLDWMAERERQWLLRSYGNAP